MELKIHWSLALLLALSILANVLLVGAYMTTASVAADTAERLGMAVENARMCNEIRLRVEGRLEQVNALFETVDSRRDRGVGGP